MLTSDQSIVQFDHGQAFPDRLTRVTHKHYVDYAARMIAVYQRGMGRTRRELHKSVQNILAAEPDCERRRIAAFCKLLDDAGEFDTDRKGAAAALRLKVFSLAAPAHPLVTEPDKIFERSEGETKNRISTELGMPWSQIESSLYVDVIDHQPLLKFEGFESPADLLSAYNLAQVQACLYKAQRMTVVATTDFAAIVRYAKLARLLMEIRRLGPERFQLELSGPATVLSETRRYGVNFARFTAALVACRGWEMRAIIPTPWRTQAHLRLSASDGYKSHVQSPAEFDSEVESLLAEKWKEPIGGWKLIREGGILHHGQSTFVPDFLLRHEDGREALLEIVGFWTPEYLAAKRQTIALFRDRRIILAIPSRTAKLDKEMPDVVVYKTRIKPEKIVAALNALWSARVE